MEVAEGNQVAVHPGQIAGTEHAKDLCLGQRLKLALIDHHHAGDRKTLAARHIDFGGYIHQQVAFP
jgi:hypothetical protein